MHLKHLLLASIGWLVLAAVTGAVAQDSLEDIYPGMKPVIADIELKPGTYKLTWNADLQVSEMPHIDYALPADEARSKLSKLPELKSKKAVINAVSVGGSGSKGMVFWAVDESGGTGKGYDTAYIDTNRNLDLTDDKPLKMTEDEEDGCPATGWVLIDGADGKHPIKVRLLVDGEGGEPLALMYVRGGYTGTLDTNKGKIAVATADSNSNGLYNDGVDPSKPVDFWESPCDAIFADINGCGKLHMDILTNQEIPLTQASLIAGKLYEIRTSESGDTVTVARYSGPVGELVVKCSGLNGMDPSISSLGISGPIGTHELEKYDGKPLALPAGDYKVDTCGITLNSDSGEPIKLTCSTRLTGAVRKGEQTSIGIRGPFKAVGIDSARNFKYMNSGASNKFSWDLSLGEGVTVTGIDGVGDANIRISDKSGKILHTATAGYT